MTYPNYVFIIPNFISPSFTPWEPWQDQAINSSTAAQYILIYKSVVVTDSYVISSQISTKQNSFIDDYVDKHEQEFRNYSSDDSIVFVLSRPFPDDDIRVTNITGTPDWGTPGNKPINDTPACGFSGELCRSLASSRMTIMSRENTFAHAASRYSLTRINQPHDVLVGLYFGQRVWAKKYNKLGRISFKKEDLIYIKASRNFKPNSEVQSPIIGDENRRCFSLLNWAFFKLPIHSIESSTVADKNPGIFLF
uniref:Uncharacterized protein n=1 Tax=Romanomermis culicivorax TaxID=13658 RepID=A0A915JHL5_ROMCU